MIYLPILAMLVGLIIYLATDRPKVSEVGRIMFAFSLLALLIPLAVKTIEHFAK